MNIISISTAKARFGVLHTGDPVRSWREFEVEGGIWKPYFNDHLVLTGYQFSRSNDFSG